MSYSSVPPHCQVRSIINRLNTMQANISRSAAAIAKYAQEGNKDFVIRETMLIRTTLGNTIKEVKAKLEEAVRAQSRMSSDNKDLSSQLEILKIQLSCFTMEIAQVHDIGTDVVTEQSSVIPAVDMLKATPSDNADNSDANSEPGHMVESVPTSKEDSPEVIINDN